LGSACGYPGIPWEGPAHAAARRQVRWRWHAWAGPVEAPYRRTDYLGKRKVLMRDWADFVMAESE